MSGFWLAVVSAFIWGVSAFLEKGGLRNADPLGGVVARTLGILAGCLVFVLFFPQVPQRFYEMGWRSKIALMSGGFLASVVAQMFFYRALKIGDMGRVAAVGGAWPVFAFILSVVFYHEPVTWSKLVGIFFVMLGVAFLR
jgi:transporter family protein